MIDNLTDLLKVDPLAEAEKITGQSYKEDDNTHMLGMAMHLLHNDRVRAAAEATGDTHYNSTFDQALAVFIDLGFDIVLEDRFEDRGGKQETYLVLWHDYGILGTLESYGVTGMNNALIYYNVMSGAPLDWDVTSTGRYAVYEPDVNAYVWSGSHDVRIGFRAKFAALKAAGTFLPRWVESPHLGLMSYMDWAKTERGFTDYDAADKVRDERISRLPEHVRKMIRR